MSDALLMETGKLMMCDRGILRLLLLPFLIGFLTISSAALATMSDVDFDLLSARLANALKKGEFEKALPMIAEIKASGREYTPSLIYFEGFAYQNLGRLEEADAAFRWYLETAGKDGTYYQKALTRIVEIEERLAAVSAQRAEEQAQEEAAAAEIARVAAEKEARAQGTWEVKLQTHGDDYHQLNGVSSLPDGDIVAVGFLYSAKCPNLQNWWHLRLDAAGGVVFDQQHCAQRQGSPVDSSHNSVTALPDGQFLISGISGLGDKALAEVSRMKSDFVTIWQRRDVDALPDAWWQSSFFTNAQINSSGRLIAAGAIAARDTLQGLIVSFDVQGNRIWRTGHGLVNQQRRFHDATEISNGRVVAVGVAKEVPQFGEPSLFGSIDIYDPGNEDNIKRADGDVYVVAPEKQIKGLAQERYIAVAPATDGGFVVAGYVFLPESEDRTLALVARYDSKGHKIWERRFGNEAGTNRVLRIIPYEGGYIGAGNLYDDTKNRQGWIFRIDDNGELNWGRTYGGPGRDGFLSATVRPGGEGFLVAGSSDGQGWLMKLDAEGRLAD